MKKWALKQLPMPGSFRLSDMSPTGVSEAQRCCFSSGGEVLRPELAWGCLLLLVLLLRRSEPLFAGRRRRDLLRRQLRPSTRRGELGHGERPLQTPQHCTADRRRGAAYLSEPKVLDQVLFVEEPRVAKWERLL